MITDEEKERRREAFRHANASVRLSGGWISADEIAVQEQFIDGEIEWADFMKYVQMWQPEDVRRRLRTGFDQAMRGERASTQATLGPDGMLTIPDEIIRNLALEAGDRVRLIKEGAALRLALEQGVYRDGDE